MKRLLLLVRDSATAGLLGYCLFRLIEWGVG
jgi:hypothetical protein